MELIRGIQNLRPEHHGCVATIGNFDGVHLGHQAVIGQLAEKGNELGVPTLVMVFEPQPLEVFKGDQAPARLTRFREKLRALARFAVDRLLCVRFSNSFAQMSAEAFIKDVLVKGLGIRYLVVGDDFRFGAGRKGDFEMLQQAGEQYGFEVANLHSFRIGGERVSSTLVRQALAAGKMETAEKLLGRPYRMCGRVSHGEKIGRTLGIPTANIYLHRKVSPVQGIYVVEVFGLKGEPLQGVASVGNRPTIGGTTTLLEVYIFDFNDDIYGQYLNIDFLYKIRDEKKFDSLEELKRWIEDDVVKAKDWFAKNK
jgi:riboflavin kinase/FMN adenylyltransferase